MKRHNVILGLIFFSTLLFPFKPECQTPDTINPNKHFDKMLLLAKLNLLPYILGADSADVVCSFLNEPIKYKNLASKGFASHIIFFKIHVTWEHDSNFLFLYDGDLVFAFNTRSEVLYKLKGFKENDFKTFFDDLYFSNIDYTYASELDLKSKKKFLEAFYIEGLDLDCLFSSIKKQRKKVRLTSCMAPIRSIKN